MFTINIPLHDGHTPRHDGGLRKIKNKQANKMEVRRRSNSDRLQVCIGVKGKANFSYPVCWSEDPQRSLHIVAGVVILWTTKLNGLARRNLPRATTITSSLALPWYDLCEPSVAALFFVRSASFFLFPAVERSGRVLVLYLLYPFHPLGNIMLENCGMPRLQHYCACVKYRPLLLRRVDIEISNTKTRGYGST